MPNRVRTHLIIALVVELCVIAFVTWQVGVFALLVAVPVFVGTLIAAIVAIVTNNALHRDMDEARRRTGLGSARFVVGRGGSGHGSDDGWSRADDQWASHGWGHQHHHHGHGHHDHGSHHGGHSDSGWSSSDSSSSSSDSGSSSSSSDSSSSSC